MKNRKSICLLALTILFIVVNSSFTLFFRDADDDIFTLDYHQLKGNVKSMRLKIYDGSILFGQIVACDLCYVSTVRFNKNGYGTEYSSYAAQNLLRKEKSEVARRYLFVDDKLLVLHYNNQDTLIYTDSVLFDSRRNAIETVNFHRGGNRRMIFKNDYYKNGKIREIEQKSIYNGEFESILIKQYDKKEQLLKVIFDKSVLHKFKYNRGKLAERIDYYNNAIEKYVLVSESRTKKIEKKTRIKLTPNDTIHETTISRYKKGNIVSCSTLNEQGDTIRNVLYDYEHGRMIRKLIYENGDLENEMIVSYDSANRSETINKFIYSDGKILRHEKEIFDYDKRGNWIRKSSMDMKTLGITVEERDIQYYH